MSVETTIHGNNLGIIHKWSGPISPPDIFSLNRKVISSAEFEEYLFWLTDFSDLTDIQFSRVDVEKVINLNQEAQRINPDLIAVVITSKELAYGLSRMWEIMADLEGINWDKMIIKNKEDACAFIEKKIKEKCYFDTLQWVAIAY